MTKVSVVIPTYNRADVLERCIKSVFTQTINDLEIIVIDDCSTDETKSVVDSFEKDIIYIRHDENRGGSVSRNTGIEAANGEYVAFLDSDDEWLPRKIEKQLDLFDRSPDTVGVVYTGLYFSEQGNRRIGRLPKASGDIYKDQLMRDHVGPTSTVMVRRECFDSVGMFDPELPARQDYDMWLRLSEEYQFRYVRDPLTVIHTNRDDRISAQYEQRIEADQLILKKVSCHSSKLNNSEQKEIMAKQYETTALFAYLSHSFSDARMYSLKSIRSNPFNVSRWGILLLSTLCLNPDGELVSTIRNYFRALKYRLHKRTDVI